MIEIETNSVREFMRAILPTEPHFAGPPAIYRGQARATWGLVPSLWRAASWEPLGGAECHGLHVIDGRVADGSARVRDVGDSLSTTFAKVVHRLGVPLIDFGGVHTEALAQHHGLPTRLLDWTRSPFFAAYFAAADATRSRMDGGRIVVYAMSDLYLHNSKRMEALEKPDVGGLSNPNMVAQQGRFIRVDRDPPDMLAGVARSTVPVGEPLPPLLHHLDDHLAAITLSHEHAPKLLKVLQDQGIHAATLFPGQMGVAELVREVLRIEATSSPLATS